MAFINALEKSLTKFGMNNSPSVVAMGIAMAKGIFRPMFTMMDRKEDYQTKRYTALREGLTEMIAIPVYYLSGVLSKKLAQKIAVPKNFMTKDELMNLVNRSLFGTIGYVDEDGKQNIRKVFCVWHKGLGKHLISTNTSSAHVKSLRKNSNACLYFSFTTNN